MYTVMAVLALFYLPVSFVSLDWTYRGIRLYTNWVRWSARVIVGLHSEIRGEVPTGPTLICSKHQSFFDVLLLCNVVPNPRFVMKRLISRTPIVGYYGKRIGCIVVDRGKGATAVRQLVHGAGDAASATGQIIIFPQGTRVAPGDVRKYKIGAAVLYDWLGQECVPVATNVGVFWPRIAIYRKPGTAVVEFLPALPAGIPNEKFLARIEESIESHSNRLMEEAGFDPVAKRKL